MQTEMTKGQAMTTPEERVAQRMYQARTRADLSQKEASRRLDITERTYGRWERGETLGFVGRIADIADALETTPDDLLAGEHLAPPSAEELGAKLDVLLGEVRALRRDFDDSKRKPRR